MAEFKETRRQTGIQKKALAEREVRRQRRSMFQICYKFGTRNVLDSAKSVQNLKTNY
jgi:hypothetical protein